MRVFARPVVPFAAPLFGILLCLVAATAQADTAANGAAAAAPATPCPTSAPPPAVRPNGETGGKHLPADAVTHHRLDLPGRTLCFTAVAGSIKLTDGPGENPTAEVAYIAYTLDETEARSRPVTFAFNGGPGIASGWLQLGGIGPWRLPMAGGAVAPSAQPIVGPNAETWLDFTDLVFVDPVGTGFSRSLVKDDEARRRFWSVDGDIGSLSEIVWQWLGRNDRLASPKFIMGESYGGFRGPKLAHELRTRWNVGLSGLVLMSPVLDFGRFAGAFNTLDWVAHLPSYAAIALAQKGPVTREALADVERYALGDYLADLMRGVNDPAALDRLSARVADYAGLDPAVVRRAAGRVTPELFRREFDRSHHRIVSLYDGTVTGDAPQPYGSSGRIADPVLDGLQPPIASAMTELYAHELGWKIDDARYDLVDTSVNRQWEWGRGEPEAITDLKSELALDPHLRVLITHGFSDLVTPYFETRMLLDQIPAYGDPGRLALKVYGGGHMQYTDDASRRALREDARALIERR